MNPDSAEEKKRNRKAYRLKNIEKIRKQHREWERAHKDAASQRAKRWYKNNRQYVAAKGKKYREEKREIINAKKAEANRLNPLQNRIRAAKWAKRNRRRHKENCRRGQQRRLKLYPEIFRDNCSRRRAKLRSVTIGDSATIRAFYRMVRTEKSIACHWCKKNIPIGRRHVDHKMPITRGGAHTIKNLVASCEKCNKQKCNKTPREFLRWRKTS